MDKVTVADESNAENALHVFKTCMETVPAWIVGLPLAAEGGWAEPYDSAKRGGNMSVDVVGSYLELNKFLEPRGMEVVPNGNLLEVMGKRRGRVVFAGVTTTKVRDWVKDEFGVRILVEGV